ncbi:hypothetical protein KKG05_07090 [bacterium]|nr:hypothetical protein [bacterium]
MTTKRNKNTETAFVIRMSEIQDYAIRLMGRPLTEAELWLAAKGIESGLSFGLETVMETAVTEAVNL